MVLVPETKSSNGLNKTNTSVSLQNSLTWAVPGWTVTPECARPRLLPPGRCPDETVHAPASGREGRARPLLWGTQPGAASLTPLPSHCSQESSPCAAGEGGLAWVARGPARSGCSVTVLGESGHGSSSSLGPSVFEAPLGVRGLWDLLPGRRSPGTHMPGLLRSGEAPSPPCILSLDTCGPHSSPGS